MSRTHQTEECTIPRNHRAGLPRTSHIPPAVKIENGPIQVKDRPFLVKITANGEDMYVSPWSIKDGVYHPGLDSEFLVHRLSVSKH